MKTDKRYQRASCRTQFPARESKKTWLLQKFVLTNHFQVPSFPRLKINIIVIVIVIIIIPYYY